MNADKVDTLIMLLSTDWFLPYWGLIGMYLEDGPQICVQQGCRNIVQEIVSGRAEYYHVDFSQKRVEATRRAFIALLKNCGADPGIPVELLLSNGTDAIFEEGTQWLITVLTGRLLQGRATNELDPQVVTALEGLRFIVELSKTINFEELCLRSNSEWDRYTRSVTPDIPGMLGHQVTAILSRDEFAIIWNYIQSKLTNEQRRHLLQWYELEARSLTGKDLTLV